MVTKFLRLLFICNFIFIYSNAQTTFERIIGSADCGEESYNIIKTSDGGYITTGLNACTEFGVEILKTDEKGDSVWLKSFALRSSSKDSANAFKILETSDNGFLIIGVSEFPDDSGDYFNLLKTDVNGDSLWAVNFGDKFTDSVYAKAWVIPADMIETSDGGYLLGGSIALKDTSNNDSLHWELFWLKVDESGTVAWHFNADSSRAERIQALVQPNDSEYVMAGVADSNLLIMKTDTSGNIKWHKTYDDSNYHFIEARDLIYVNDTTYQILGNVSDNYFFSFSKFNNKTFGTMLSADDSGNVIWQNTYDTIGTNNFMNEFISTYDGAYCVAGYTADAQKTKAIAIKTDSAGHFIWKKVYRDTKQSFTRFRSVIQDPIDSGFVFAGMFQRNIFDNYIVKTDSLGDIECPTQVPVPEICVVSVNLGNKAEVIWNTDKPKYTFNIFKLIDSTATYDKISDFDSNIYVYTDTTSLADSVSESFKISQITNCDDESDQSLKHSTILLTMEEGQDTSWTLTWTPYKGRNPIAYNIYKVAGKSMTLVGRVSGANFSWTERNPPVGAITYRVEADFNDLRCGKNIVTSFSNTVTGIPTGISVLDFSELVEIYPHPVINSSILKFPNPGFETYNLNVITAMGQVARAYRNITSNQVVIQKSDLPAGLYFYELSGEEGIKAKGKLVIN